MSQNLQITIKIIVFIKISTINIFYLLKNRIKMMTYTGTLAFSAPEILNGNEYTEIVDM